MRLGINLSIDVTKLDKSRFFKGKKGTYAKLTCFVDTEETSQYGDNGTITQEVSKGTGRTALSFRFWGTLKFFGKTGNLGSKVKSDNRSKIIRTTGMMTCRTVFPFRY